ERSAAAEHGPLHLAAMLALQDGLTFLEGALASPQPQLHLGQAVCEIDADGDEGQATFGSPPQETVDLAAVKEQLPPPPGVVTSFHSLLVRWDVHVLEPDLPTVDPGERLRQGRPARAEGLHLRSRE